MKKKQKSTWYKYGDNKGAPSKFGQMIGDAFADLIINLIQDYLTSAYPEYILLEPEKGKMLVRLEMMGGTSRQMDNVIVPKNSIEPVALFESKWLKDGRHHNDKGAWILQLKEIRKRYPTVRGATANLIGYWTEGVRVMFETEAGIKMVLVATDDEVYSTLQTPLNEFLEKYSLPPLVLNVAEIRDSLPRPWDLANFLIELEKADKLVTIAKSWLDFTRAEKPDGTPVLGSDAVKEAIDQLLGPLPDYPQVKVLEVALQIDTGNTIYKSFTDSEQAMEFIQTYFQNPQEILKKITPKQSSQNSPDFENIDPINPSGDSAL